MGAVAVGALFGARVVGLGNSPLRLEMAERMGANAVYMSDDPELGARLDEFTGGAGIDLVVLTANPWPAYRTAVQIVRPSGRVSIVSLLGRGEPALDFNPLAMEWFYMKGISVIAVNGPSGYLYPGPAGEPAPASQGAGGFLTPRPTDERFSWNRSCEHLLSLMADGRLEPRRLVTHRMHYTDIAQAFEMAFRREKGMLGVVFDWRDAPRQAR
jgi:threonine dehydrogenase-like Zn-dependent dehydrogenase